MARQVDLVSSTIEHVYESVSAETVDPGPSEAFPAPDGPADRQQVLAELRRRMAGLHDDKVTQNIPGMGSEGVGMLPVLPVLSGLFPRGGLPRGGVVSVTGDAGATSLLFALLAGPQRSWSAVVGMPGLGLLAAAELGVDLAKVVLVPDPGPDVLQILSVLADGVELIAVAAPSGSLGAAARLRVLTGKLRQHGAIVLVSGGWPGAELVLRTRTLGWTGLGQGHGRLRDREMEVTVAGRGAAGRLSRSIITLRSDRNAVAVTAGTATSAGLGDHAATGTTG
jgi:hypothetical protein